MKRLIVPRRNLVLPRRFRQAQGGFLLNPYRFGHGGGGTMWTTTATHAFSSNSSGWSGYTLRVIIPSSALAAGSKLRITITARPGVSLVINNAYIQSAAASGDPYDYSTTPVQVLFSGSGGVTVAAGASVLTDDIALSPTGTENFVFAIYFTTASSIGITASLAGWSSWYIYGNRTTTVNESSFTSIGASTCAVITKVEVWN